MADRLTPREEAEILAYISNNWGREDTIEAPPPVAPAGEGTMLSLVKAQPKKQLITVDMTRIAPPEILGYAPGSWVVVLQAEVIENSGFPETRIPLEAEIQAGAGGTQTVLFSDAYKAIVPLYSSYAKVKVGWQQVDENTAQVFQNLGQGIPRKVRVRATVQRSFADGELSTRTVPVAIWFASVPEGSRRITIPPLAKCWRLSMGDPSQVTSSGLTYAIRTGFDNGGAVVDADSDSTRIENFARNLCCRPLNPNAGELLLSAPDGPIVADVVFELGL